MRTQRRRKLLALFIPTVLVVLVDQWSKFLVRTNPSLHNYELVDGLLAFHYTQNPGMALGMQWADTYVISIVAIAATLFITGYILLSLPRAKKWYLVFMGLILGGALGNIIDRLFMARIQNYGTYLEGHVVDFIHFTFQINDFAVFPYIFNVADMAISTSLIVLLIFHNRLLPGPYADEEREDAGEETSHNEDTEEILGERNGEEVQDIEDVSPDNDQNNNGPNRG